MFKCVRRACIVLICNHCEACRCPLDPHRDWLPDVNNTLGLHVTNYPIRLALNT